MKLIEIGSFQDGKRYIYGECFILQTIDMCWTTPQVKQNFGTDKLPVGRYKHTSVSHKTRYPTWEELKEIKELLHGDVTVLQIMPPKNYYVNLHENCFHLWELL